MLEQKWYTVADVAALTGLTDRTIRNYLKEGTLHGKKVGVQWRFTQQDIESLFREADVTGPLTELLDELVSDFLHGSQRPQEMECRILDIPCKTEELWKNIVKKLRKQIDEKGEDGRRSPGNIKVRNRCFGLSRQADRRIPNGWRAR